MNIISFELSTHGKAVLVVEDEPMIRWLVADYFKDAGYKVFESSSADDALSIIHQTRNIAAIFTDVEMPGSANGLVLAATIMKKWPEIVVLITSGRVQPGTEIPTGTNFISKPYDISSLIQKITLLLNDRDIDVQCHMS